MPTFKAMERMFQLGPRKGPQKRSRYLVIRQVATDELLLVLVKIGQRIEPEDGYRFAGPFKSKAAANRALDDMDTTLEEALYGTTPQETMIVD
jgi:hypothetical protein